MCLPNPPNYFILNAEGTFVKADDNWEIYELDGSFFKVFFDDYGKVERIEETKGE